MQCTYVFVNRYLVVVQDDQQVGLQAAGMVEPFKGHASAHGSITNHGNNAFLTALFLGSDRHAQCGRYGRGRVPRTKCIVGAFFPFRKTADAALFTVVAEGFPPTGENLVGISLVAYIPDEFVVG